MEAGKPDGRPVKRPCQRSRERVGSSDYTQGQGMVATVIPATVRARRRISRSIYLVLMDCSLQPDWGQEEVTRFTWKPFKADGGSKTCMHSSLKGGRNPPVSVNRRRAMQASGRAEWV